jgi:hypothetical protein
MGILQGLPDIITAVGGLGTAAFGLVDSTKVFGGGVNRIGFKRIATSVRKLTPKMTVGLTQERVLGTLRGNWYNGTALNDQKAIAKSLIKQGLNPENAEELALQTGVDKVVLGLVAAKIKAGTALLATESDVYSRFDFVLTALLDEVYQLADQAYTNWTRVWASIFSIVLALVGGAILHESNMAHAAANAVKEAYLGSTDMKVALVAGLLATPLAPIAKDLSSALAAAVNTMQMIRK